VILLNFGGNSVLDIVGSALDIRVSKRSISLFLLQVIRLFIYLQDVFAKCASQGADNKRTLNLIGSRNSKDQISTYLTPTKPKTVASTTKHTAIHQKIEKAKE